MADYDIGEAFQRIEEIMIASMKRNLSHHLDLEHEENINYTQWQAEQIAAMKDFQSRNKKLFNGYFSTIDSQIDDVLNRAYSSGEMDQEIKILEAIKKGWKQRATSGSTVGGEFFHLNDDKLISLVNATKQDMHNAETAMLRMTDDQYRKTIFNSMVYHQSGAGNLAQCIDMATKDFLSRGINCIQYSDGRRVSIDHYAEMALRTAHTRAYLQGEAKKRDEWGINTVIMNKRSAGCPKCMRYAGKVFYDDVWSSIPVRDNKYPRLSSAIADGLYHPNCKDIHTTYFEGINTPPEPPSEQEERKAQEVFVTEQKHNYNERQIKKYGRLEQGSIAPENVEKYKTKRQEWQKVQKNFEDKNKDILSLEAEKEKLMSLPEPTEINSSTKSKYVTTGTIDDIITQDDANALNFYKSSQSYIINYKLRNKIPLTEDERNAIGAIDTALLKLPKYKGIVFRSIRSSEVDDIEKFNIIHSEGNLIKYLAYTSASVEIYDKTMDIQFIIISKHGRDMRKFNTLEQEILFQRGSIFVCTGREGNTIYLSEV